MFYFMVIAYIFGIDCQTTLQVQEKLVSRLPIEIYVQLRCCWCVRILGNIGALQKYYFRDRNKGKKVKASFIILRTKQIFSGANFRTLVANKGKLLKC